MRLSALLVDCFRLAVCMSAVAYALAVAAGTGGGLMAGLASRFFGASQLQTLGWAAGLGLLAGTAVFIVAQISLYYLLLLIFLAVEVTTARTPAKQLMGLCVRSADGRPATRLQLLARGLAQDGGAVLWFLSVTGLPFGALSLPWTLVATMGCFTCLGQRRQALHDRVSGTAVFRIKDLSAADLT